MMSFQPFLLLATIFVYLTSVSGVPTVPTSYFLASAQVKIGPALAIVNPLGTRLSIGFASGTFVDYTGTTIGNLVAGIGGENGLVDAVGTTHIDGRLTVALTDGSHAYVQYHGSGLEKKTDYFDASVETDSNNFGFLNTIFIWGNATATDTTLSIDFFTTTNPA